jgi:hypothetical protein
VAIDPGMGDSEGETARAELRRVVSLPLADDFLNGWRGMVLLELDRMRAEMPYADELRLSCTRRPD